MLLSVVASICDNGAAYQWSADITENGHITLVKDPSQHGNNQDYEAQICRSLDRSDKIRRFELATSIRAAGVHFGQPAKHNADPDDWDDNNIDDDAITPHVIDRTSTLLVTIQSTSTIAGTNRQQIDYFVSAHSLALKNRLEVPLPLRTFTSANTAFHLTRDPSMSLSVDDTSVKFDLPDLRQALADYIRHTADPSINILTLQIGGWRSAAPGCRLPSDMLRIWTKVRMQVTKFHYPGVAAEPRTVMSSPSLEEWPTGQYDTVLVNTDPNQRWPESGLKGLSCTEIY